MDSNSEDFFEQCNLEFFEEQFFKVVDAVGYDTAIMLVASVANSEAVAGEVCDRYLVHQGYDLKELEDDGAEFLKDMVDKAKHKQNQHTMKKDDDSAGSFKDNKTRERGKIIGGLFDDILLHLKDLNDYQITSVWRTRFDEMLAALEKQQLERYNMLKEQDIQRSVVEKHDTDTIREKPPRGIMPREVWLKKRLAELHNTFDRYRAAGKFPKMEWFYEAGDIAQELKGLKS